MKVIDANLLIEKLISYATTVEDAARNFAGGASVVSVTTMLKLIESGSFDAPAAAEGWRPIETAPKTGVIWLANYHSMRLGYWMDGRQHECRGTVGGGWKDFAISDTEGTPRDLRFTPTKWMTTPSLPNTRAAGGGG